MLKINKNLCCGCQCCATAYPDTFKIVNGKSEVIGNDETVNLGVCLLGAITFD